MTFWMTLASINGTSAGSVVLAVTLIGFAGWLQHRERSGWAGEHHCNSQSSVDREYLQARARSRRRTNILIGAIGLIVLLTAIVSHPVAWMSAWLIVMLCLIIVIGLAGVDVVRTHRYHQKKLGHHQKQLDAIRQTAGTSQLEP